MTSEISIWKKITRSKVLFVLFLISLFWSASLFIAPLSVPHGSVQGLDGYANNMDYMDLWVDMPAYPKYIYSTGDAQCHQKWYRSLSLNGNQMPVDSRSAAIYISFTVGLFTAMLATPSFDASESFISIFPGRIKKYVRDRNWDDRFVWLMLILFIAPTGIDGVVQLVTSYESTNFIRVITGSMAGWVLGVLFGAMMTSIGELGGRNINGRPKTRRRDRIMGW